MPSERKALRLLCDGLSDEQIAERCGMSLHSARCLLNRLASNLAPEAERWTRRDLAHYARMRGLDQEEP
jgi:hypothetical protein